jgi:oligosaccharide repeat unit polymerase
LISIRLCILFSSALAYTLYAVISEDHYAFLLISMILSFAFILKSKFDITNPDFWFVIAINVYHLSVFMLDFIGYRVVENKYELTLVNFLSLLGYFTASIVLAKKKTIFVNLPDNISISQGVIKTFLLLLFLLTITVPLSFLLSGATNKADFDNQFGSVFSFFNLIFALYILKRKENKLISLHIILPMIYLFITSLLLGERDVFFSFMLLIIFFAYRRLNVSKVKLFSICFLLIALIPILGQFKNFFTRADLTNVEQVPIGISLLNGEFRSAGYNINYILGQDVELKYGESLINDFFRVIVPRFLYSVENSVSWYNNKYHPHIVAQGRGYGFSLAAEGYVNFGFFGVYLWFLLAGSLIVTLYNKSYQSTFYLAIYLIMLPIFIYAIRGDFSTIFSPLLKQIIMPYITIYLFYRLFRYKRLTS